MKTASGHWVGKTIASAAYNNRARTVTATHSGGPAWQWLDSGQRLHLQHGPIDLILQATGEQHEVASAYQQAHACFQSVLSNLVAELGYLQRPFGLTSVGLATGSATGSEADSPASKSPADTPVAGRIAQHMVFTAQKFFTCSQYHSCKQEGVFLTPMIAVAGSVADHVLRAMQRGRSLRRAYVNNGGDIALWLADGERFTVGICDDVNTAQVDSKMELHAQHSIGGVATSGWRGRSHSLGIADAVTVLAACSADADAAATLIANAVDLPDSRSIHRQPASTLSPDSDLGDRLVTVAVDHLTEGQIETALQCGSQFAKVLLSEGLIKAAYISLQGKVVICGNINQTNNQDLTRVNLPAGDMHA